MSPRPGDPRPLIAEVDRLARETGFSGVVRVDQDGETMFAGAYGFADRAHRLANELTTQFGVASVTKGFTATMVISLIESGVLDWTTTARSLLGSDLPLIDDAVTVEHLLTHRSGIGDYLDEEVIGDLTDYVMTVPVHQLVSTGDYVPALEGRPAKFSPGTRFQYNNSGYVILALLAERAAGVPFAELIERRVCRPTPMADTAFIRSDARPARVATGYLGERGLQSNVLHLPLLGSGDGGIATTVDDLHRFWTALFAGRIVSLAQVATMTQPRSDAETPGLAYGVGLWIDVATGAAMLEGADAGVSARTWHDPTRKLTWSVLSNSTDGAWPIARLLAELLRSGS